jgi:Tol biopolymer transport system component
MRKPAILTAAFIFLAFALGSLPIQNGYDLFQKALAKERGEGNLEEAIALYQKVIDESKDEALAAQAQLRIGFCYEKLGQAKAALAQEAFQKVVDKYPSQIETVKTAREKLVLLLKAQSMTREGGRDFEIRHVLSVTGPHESHQVSPDGRYIAYFDYGMMSIAVQELATGKTRTIKTKIAKDEGMGECWFFRWSPDGKSIVCNWWQDEPKFVWADLRILSVDGSAPRRLLAGDYSDVYPLDWSPDGRQILAVFYRGEDLKGIRIGIISAGDGSVRFLDTKVRGHLGNMGFSPDGRYIAYDSPSEEGSNKRDIFLISQDEKISASLVIHPAHDALLGWSPDGTHILFSSDRLGAPDLWAVPVADGRPAGDPRIIKRGIGEIESAGITRNGSLYYVTSNALMDIFVAEIDQEKGKITAAPKKMILPRQGNNIGPQYSPDGRSLAYIQRSSQGAEEASLCVLSLETNEERVFPLGSNGRFPRWSPDGRFVYFSSIPSENRMRIFRLDVKTGLCASVETQESDDLVFGNWFIGCSPDGKSYYYIHSEADKKICRIFVRDIERGLEQELFQEDIRLPWTAVASPDGKWLAVVSRETQRALKLVPTSGREAKVLYAFEQGGGWPTMLTWTPDGRNIIFSRENSKRESQGWGLWKISVHGGEPQDLGINTRYISEVCVHPDGKRLALSTYDPETSGSELWVMENFLPDAKAETKGVQK